MTPRPPKLKKLHLKNFILRDLAIQLGNFEVEKKVTVLERKIVFGLMRATFPLQSTGGPRPSLKRRLDAIAFVLCLGLHDDMCGTTVWRNKAL